MVLNVKKELAKTEEALRYLIDNLVAYKACPANVCCTSPCCDDADKRKHCWKIAIYTILR